MKARTLYVTDLDGTLLPSSGRLEAAEASRLGRLVSERGLALTYATARSHLTASRAIGKGWGTPAVVYNGAFTVDPEFGSVLRSHFLSSAVLANVVDACLVHDLAPLVFNFRPNAPDHADRVSWVRGGETAGVRRYLRDRSEDPRLDPQPGWGPLRHLAAFYVAVIGQPRHVRHVADLVRARVKDRCEINVQRDTYHPQDVWLEITPPRVTKGTEILALAADLNADRIICFGDNNNDASLFDIADESYAVANATESLTGRATAVIASNDEHGVIAWLEENAR